MATVRRATEEDWRELRSVRLAALEDSPQAFGSSLADEERLGQESWRVWARSAAVFIAFGSGAPVGMVAAHGGASPDERRLVALWVSPDHRRDGVASALIAHVEAWARAEGARRLTLWVTEGNKSARRAYEGHGFRVAGERKPLPSNPAAQEELLVLTLR